tara:strand:+ start:4487 stop:5491 length:1005 start_codon:yes stop_codon:yes gene_type:complete
MIYTTSSIGAFQACPKLYDLRMNHDLESKDRPSYFRLGSLFHEAKEIWAIATDKPAGLREAQKFIAKAELPEGGEDIRCKVVAMMSAYHRVWRGNGVKYHDTELEFTCVTEKGKKLAGICDAIVYHEGRWWIMETKTAATVDESYIDRMRHQRQALLYTYAIKRLLGGTKIDDHARYRDIAGVLYDFIQKPTLKRKKATPEDKRKYTKGGDLYKGQRENDESDLDYTNRMHDWYAATMYESIRRVEVVFSEHQLDAFAEDLHKSIRLIELCDSEDAWPMALSACHAYNRACEFAPYCRSANSPLILQSFYRQREKKFAEFREDIGGKDASNVTD